MSPPDPSRGPAELRRSPTVAYLLVALAAFLAGMAFGQWGAPPPGARSRIDWPDARAAP
jgi:hypothetical protein